MSTIYLPVTSEQFASLTASAAQFLVLVALSGGRPPTPDAWGAERSVRKWRIEIEEAGIGRIAWDRKAGGWVVQWTSGGDSVASAWVARHRATEAGTEYPGLGVDDYRFLRGQAPALSDADFDTRLTAAVLSARLAGIRPGSLIEWLSRGLASPSVATGAGTRGRDDEDDPRSEWDRTVAELKAKIERENT